MSGTVNKQIILGFVGRDPDIRRTQAGKRVASFSLATNETWKNADGERKERTDWHRIVCFNEKLVEIIEKYVKKGSKIFVEGQSQTRKYTDAGVEKSVTECVLQDFRGTLTLLDSKERVPDADDQDAYGSDHDEVPPKQIDEEIPF